MAIHFEMDGFALFADSEAGERQLAAEEAKRKANEEAKKATSEETSEASETGE